MCRPTWSPSASSSFYSPCTPPTPPAHAPPPRIPAFHLNFCLAPVPEHLSTLRCSIANGPLTSFDPDRCAACFEELRRVYDREEDCWFYKGVLRTSPAGQLDERGRILVHRKCFQPGNRYSTDMSPPAGTPRAAGVGAEQHWVRVKAEGSAS